MAIFVAFAWVIEAAAWLGLIEIECSKSDSRAYRLAHECVALLKRDLTGRPLDLVDERTVAVHGPDGRTLLRFQDGSLLRCGHETEPLVLLCLGPGGEVSFRIHGPHYLDIMISARTDDGGSHDIHLTLPRVRQVVPPD